MQSKPFYLNFKRYCHNTHGIVWLLSTISGSFCCLSELIINYKLWNNSNITVLHEINHYHLDHVSIMQFEMFMHCGFVGKSWFTQTIACDSIEKYGWSCFNELCANRVSNLNKFHWAVALVLFSFCCYVLIDSATRNQFSNFQFKLSKHM